MKTSVEWFQCRSLLLCENYCECNIPLFLQQVVTIDHSDARLLSSILDGCKATLVAVNSRLLYALTPTSVPELYVYFILTCVTETNSEVRAALERTVDCPISILYKCHYGVSGYTWDKAVVYDEPEAFYRMTDTFCWYDDPVLVAGLRKAAVEFGHYGAMFEYAGKICARDDPLRYNLWIKCMRAGVMTTVIRLAIFLTTQRYDYHKGRVLTALILKGGNILDHREISLVTFYQTRYVLFRNGTFATILCMQRLRVCKDIARLIGRLVWNQRATL